MYLLNSISDGDSFRTVSHRQSFTLGSDTGGLQSCFENSITHIRVHWGDSANAMKQKVIIITVVRKHLLTPYLYTSTEWVIHTETASGLTVCPWSSRFFMLQFPRLQNEGTAFADPEGLFELQKFHDFLHLTESWTAHFPAIFHIQNCAYFTKKEFSVYFWLPTTGQSIAHIFTYLI